MLASTCNFKTVSPLIPIILTTLGLSVAKMSTSDQDIFRNVTNSCHGFTKKFHKELSSTINGNIVSSPLSVHMILSLLSHGAQGSTLNELSTGLCHGELESLNKEFQLLMAILNDVQNVKLYIANALYIQKGFPLLAEFVSIGQDVFKSLVTGVNFNENKEAAEEINTWVKSSTGNLISDIVSPDDFNELTKVVLVNAVYFKGCWQHEFEPQKTTNRLFHASQDIKKLVPTMYKKAMYSHGGLPELKSRFIEIPYKNEDIAMIIILPDEIDGLQFVQTNVEWHTLEKAQRFHEEVELHLPKFKFESTIDLKDTLSKLGMNQMFDDRAADFSRLSDIALVVSKILHKAVIEVSEEGTEAAAATMAQMRLRRMVRERPTTQFHVDRPFMFIIEHRPSKLPLFVGNVCDIGTAPRKDEL